ncbi:MAG: hypothetical protein EOM13_01835 [Clostridia bacterium]|nr:hypothetical protein [Clostridia bacterium]
MTYYFDHSRSSKASRSDKRTITLTALVLSLTLLLTACGGGAAETGDSTGQSTSGQEQVFTLEQLAEFDGKEGRPAYIAVDGIVYDVSNIPQWSGGSHAGGSISAGKDYSEEIRSVSPHGTSVLSRAPQVGTLTEE